MANEINENLTFEEQNVVFDELDKAFAFLRQTVGQGNKDLDKALITFSMGVYSLGENQLISALHSFGGSFLSKSRRRMQVQPALLREEGYKFNLALLSVARRKSKIGSRQKQDTRGYGRSLDLPTRPITTKRKHSLSSVTNSNQPSAKKAGRSMISLTKHFKSKRKKKQS